ncbi:reverse transcriptase domain-containing protein [Nocardia brasiliensis]|uniref:reverse transcriptase domain-containing protein n=1 Tax=Nocardia brasiliensis TaxID=37326 RepID=UPI003796551C
MDYVTVEEAADIAGVSVATIRRRCQSGDIAANKTGNQWLIERKDVKRSGGRQRAPKNLATTYDLATAWKHVQATDLSEAWVPDVLRFRDYIDNTDTLLQLASSRLSNLQFDPALRVDIPKSTVSNRPGVVLNIVDRICYQAVVLTFADKVDLLISPNVFSSRIARSGKYFMERGTTRWVKFEESVLKSAQKGTDHWVGQTDISSYFEHIHHSILFNELSAIGVTGDPLRALRVMLSRWAAVEGMGLPQGPNASRLLGNFYLARVDDEMLARNHGYFRYMDDIRIVAKSKSRTVAAIRDFEHLSRRRGLICASSKTVVLDIKSYKTTGDNKEKAVANYFFEANSINQARPRLRKILNNALKSDRPDQRDLKFSLWRLSRIRDHHALKRILSQLEDLAPLATVVAAYLQHFVSRNSVQIGLSEFLANREVSHSMYLRCWLYAVMLECRKPPAKWIELARLDVQDQNNPYFLRAVAACVLARGRLTLDIAWIRDQFDVEHDPIVLRAYLVALAFAEELDGLTAKNAVGRFPQLKWTTTWLKGRKELPSLLSAKQVIAIR